MRVIALVAGTIALAAPTVGCGKDEKVSKGEASCRAFAFAIASIDAGSAPSSMAVCDEVTGQNADQTIYDMQQRCVRLASSQQRKADKNIPSEQSVRTRNAAIEKCNAASALVSGG